MPVDREPLTPFPAAFRGPASGPTSSRLIPLAVGTSMPSGFLEIQVPSLARDPWRRPFGSRFEARCPGWPARAGAVLVRRCTVTSTRPRPRRSHGAKRGRARSCDLCRWMPPRARPRTTRTSRSTNCGRDDCLSPAGRRPSVQSSRRSHARSGADHPMADILGRDCSPPRLCPDARSLRAPPVTRRLPFSGLERHEEGRKPANAERTCKVRTATGW